jgi:molybdopterin synthase catalytic subunit
VPHLTSEPIDFMALLESVRSPERGGITSFLGTVRDHHRGRSVLRLRYSAYVPMAEAECARIVAEAGARWPVRLAIQHRIGELGVGDTALAAVAASAHREAAFEACRYVVEEVKRTVPIWKQEYYADGSVEWVDPTAADRRITVEST